MRFEHKLFRAWRGRQLVELVNHVIFEMDLDGHWLFLNSAWRTLTGYTVAFTLGGNFLDNLHPTDRKKGLLFFQSLLEGQQESARETFRFCDAGGEARWVEMYARLNRAADEDGALLSIAGTLTDVSERKALESELQAEARAQEAELARQREQLRSEQMALAAEFAREIAAPRPLEALFGWLTSEVNERFGYYQTQLALYEAVSETATVVAAAGDSGAAAGSSDLPPLLVDQALVEQVAATGEPLLLATEEAQALLNQAQSALISPVTFGDEVLGALLVFSERDEITEDEQVLLGGLCSQLATAMESLNLRDEMEERLNELNNLQRLMSREGWLRIRAMREGGTQGYRFDRQTLAPLSGEQPVLDGAPPINGDSNGSRKQIAAPLQVRGETFGILGVEDDPQAPLSEEEEELLYAVSQQVAEAMEHARLLEQTQKRAVELETVSRVSAATSTILEREKLLDAVVELTKRSFDLYHAHIYLLDEEKEDLVLAAGAGEPGEKMLEQGWHISLNHPGSIVARAAREKEGIVVNDVSSATNYLSNPLLPETRSELAVPMIAGNRLLGVLDVQADVVNYFTQDDVRIQEALANQVGIALQNATLYEEQLNTAEKLRELDRLKSEFLASMSHELRTPLNSIIGFADVLLEGIDGELNERMEEDVILIRNSGRHLRELIGDILDMSKIEAGMMDLRYEEIDIPSMVRDFEAFASTQLRTYEKELEFTVELGEDVGVIVADRTRFTQVLYNLISNAIKFTAEGQVTLSLQMDGDQLRVEVSDTGIGIEKENVPIVFEQFRQVDGSLTRQAGGTGLGLPISKSLVELHGGKIWVESEVGEGTTFAFTIPRTGRSLRKRETGPLPELPQP